MSDKKGFMEFVTNARNILLLLVLLGQVVMGGVLWLTRDREIESLRQNQSKIMRILRQDFREECSANGNPIAECEKRLRSDDRYWPNTSVLYRVHEMPPVHFMYALYRG